MNGSWDAYLASPAEADFAGANDIITNKWQRRGDTVMYRLVTESKTY